MPVQVYFVMEDAKGDQSTVVVDLPGATTPTNANAFRAAMQALIGDLTNGRMVNAGVRYDISDPLLGVGAALDSDVQEKAFFAFRSVGGFLKTLTVPTILESLFVPGTKLLDQSDADVGAFITAMTDGIDVSGFGGTGTVQPSTSHGEDLTDVEEAREAWGKYRP